MNIALRDAAALALRRREADAALKDAARRLARAIDQGIGFGDASREVLRAAVEWVKADRGEAG